MRHEEPVDGHTRATVDLHAGDKVYYHISVDAMVPDAGWFMTNDTDLVWLTDFGWVFGIRTTVTHAFYDESHFLPDESTDDPNMPTVRTGPLVAWVIDDEMGTQFNKPTVLVIVNWWLTHRYRTGADVSQWIPYVVAGFRFEGDLWSGD